MGQRAARSPFAIRHLLGKTERQCDLVCANCHRIRTHEREATAAE
jgi:hypothetical protein